MKIPSFDFAQFSLSSPLQHHCGWKFPDGITLPFFAVLPVLRIMTSNQHANCHTSGAAPKQQWPRLRNRPKMAAVLPQEPPQNGGRPASGTASKWRPSHLRNRLKMAAVPTQWQLQDGGCCAPQPGPAKRKKACSKHCTAVCSGDSFSSLMYAFFLHLKKKKS